MTSPFLRIVVTDESETRIEYTEREGIKYIVSCNGNTLSITGKRHLKWYNHIGIFWEKTHMTLYINKSELASLRISDTGDISGVFLTEKIFYVSSNTGKERFPMSFWRNMQSSQ